MQTATLYYATNRKHQGPNRWKPTGYATVPSSDGAENLRFGELTASYNPAEVQKHLTVQSGNNRTGNGEALANYLKKPASQANITAYDDPTVGATAHVETSKNSSVQMFNAIKARMMAGSDALVYIHGYNVSWDEAVASALALQFMLNATAQREVIIVLFSWPSLGSMSPYAAYRSDRASARDSANAIGRGILKLRDFLSTLKRSAVSGEQQLCNSDIHMLCHSMGNYVLQKAVETKLIGYSAGAMPRIFKHIFLCAADVDDNVMELGQSLDRLHELASYITIYFNEQDKALYISETTKNQAARLGQGGCSRPALVHNKIHQVDCTPIVRGFTEHSYYLWATVNEDIRQSINGVEFDGSTRNRRRNGQNREWTLQ